MSWFESEPYKAARQRINELAAVQQAKLERIPVDEAKRRIEILFQQREGYPMCPNDEFVAYSPHEGQLASRAGIKYRLGYNKGAC